MSRILVTGASGFVGNRLVAYLASQGLTPRIAVRSRAPSVDSEEICEIGDIGPQTVWKSALHGVDVVVHLAARAHQLHDKAADPLLEFMRVNAEGSLNLARQAAASGVRRFVLISSIGVNGAETYARPFTATDPPAPHSPYSVSKLEAETSLRRVAAETGMEVVIIRPPLVIGPNAPGNFGKLVRLLRTGLPLPLGSIQNRRSYVSVDNLVDLIVTCTRHERAAGQVFLVSDGFDISTPDLLRRLCHAMDRPARLMPVPPTLLRAGAALFRRRAMIQQLCGSLQVDIQETRRQLDWSAPISLDEGLRRAVTTAPEL